MRQAISLIDTSVVVEAKEGIRLRLRASRPSRESLTGRTGELVNSRFENNMTSDCRKILAAGKWEWASLSRCEARPRPNFDVRLRCIVATVRLGAVRRRPSCGGTVGENDLGLSPFG
jgi:hypothetical protein